MSSSSNTVFSEADYQKVISEAQQQPDTPANKPAPANKKLSESRLRLAAIQALPTVVEAEITLKEAVKGTNRSFTVNDQTPCLNCINLKPVNRLQCSECKGLGCQQVERQIDIVLPAGTLPGSETRHSGLGASDIRSGKNGDLLVRVKLIEHPLLKVEGKNINYILSVSLYEAILGGEVQVPTATGKVVMNLQPLTQSGSIYRLKGLGLAGGDQLVSVEVSLPQTLNKEQIILFQKIATIANDAASRNTLVPAI
jgi:DnaJ-class molecular chaperone